MKYLMKEMIPMLVRARMMEFCHKNKVELDRKAIKIFVISCISKDGVKKLIEFLDETGMKRIQLLGFPNTGKTTLLNELAKINKPTSKVPGTTVHIT